MKRSFKTLAVAVTTIALTTANGSLVSACGGRSGGGGGSYARASFGGHSSYSSHGSYGGHYGGTSTYASSCPTSQYASPVYSQPAPLHSVHSQPIPSQQQFNQTVAPSRAPSNFGATGLNQSRPLQTAPNPSTTNASFASSRTQPTSSANPTPSVTAPTQSSQPRSQQASPPTSQPQSAEASALQMLASISSPAESQTEESSAVEALSQVPEFTAASSTTAGTHVGNWKVNLPGNQSVELTLADDGNFSWTATKDRKSNSFSGQYRLENGQLTLVRSNDLQQMSGQWTGSEGNFTFKLEGATNGGLNFQRS
ncbi:hypothetical protein SH528x_006723 [Novipirellula sp. SH528]|uniref:hypothetical protein n=1 Tax=Novipirellula sp. SH528 TaxID=3454466 RepID=UPI003FA0059C